MAKLKALLKALDEVPESLHEMYTKIGDDFVLDIEDKDFKSKLGEFRDNNNNLKKTKEDIEAKLKDFEGLDPAEYKKLLHLRNELDKNEDSELIKSGKIEDLIKKRTSQMEQDFNKRFKDATTARESAELRANDLTKQLRGLKIRTTVIDKIGSVAVPRQGAIDDITNRANSVFDIDDTGEVINKNFYNKKGELGSIEEYAHALVETAPFLFEAATGGGANGSRSNTKTGPGGIRVIPNDPIEIGKYFKEIASGTVVVQEGRQAQI